MIKTDLPIRELFVSGINDKSIVVVDDLATLYKAMAAVRRGDLEYIDIQECDVSVPVYTVKGDPFSCEVIEAYVLNWSRKDKSAFILHSWKDIWLVLKATYKTSTSYFPTQLPLSPKDIKEMVYSVNRFVVDNDLYPFSVKVNIDKERIDPIQWNIRVSLYAVIDPCECSSSTGWGTCDKCKGLGLYGLTEVSSELKESLERIRKEILTGWNVTNGQNGQMEVT